ncbi:MAG TPA: hypothetical protein VEK08_17005 [Planctomycetota bacterium]|nr:hypothetical protein [Planctomycetota bacterium]
MSALPRRLTLAACILFSVVLAPFAAAGEKKELEEALARSAEAARQAADAAVQAREAAAQVKELKEQVEQALKLAKEAVALATEAAKQARVSSELVNAREAKEREKEAKLEAARKQREAEKKEAAAEDEAEKKNSERVSAFFEGKVILFGSDVERPSPDVVGEFEQDGKRYLLKLGVPEVLRDLQQVDGQKVTLNGKVRNQGKYFIVMSVPQGGVTPAASKRRGGI